MKSIPIAYLSAAFLSALTFLPLNHAMAQGEESVIFPELTEVIRELRVAEPRAELDSLELLNRCAGSVDAYEFLFERLETRRVPAFGEAGVQTLSEAQADLILAALAEAPMYRVLSVRDSRLEQIKEENESTPEKYARASAKARSAAIQVTGISGQSEGVDYIFAIALIDDEESLSKATESIFEDALLKLLTADPKGIDRLHTSWYAGHEALIVPALRAVGRSGNAGGLSFIEEIIRWSPENVSAASAQIRVLGQSCISDQNERIGEALVEQIDEDEPAQCVAISQALGGLRSETGIEAMIKLLDFELRFDLGDSSESTERRVREMALWALQQITSRRFGADPSLWRLWLKEEKRWMKESSTYWVRRLVSQDSAVSAEAIRTISKRRYGRDKLALELARVLEVGQDEVKPMACVALANLGSKPVMPWLLEALDDPSDELAEAAWVAMRSLTGKDIPLDREAWCMALPEEAQYGW